MGHVPPMLDRAHHQSRRGPETPRRPGLLPLATLGLVACVCAPAHGFHSTFGASLERIEIDGNVFGAHDGVADWVDEFDGDVLGPDWRPPMGTVIQSGGVLTLQNPGMDFPYEPKLDQSVVSHATPAARSDGSYTVVAQWTPNLSETDRRVHLQLVGHGDWLFIESAGLSITNLSPAVAAAYGPSVLPGYAISQELSRLNSGYDPPALIRYDAVPLDPASVTGSIVFRLAVDVEASMVTTSFSLDGGATFQSPFPPLPMFWVGGVVKHDIIAGAAAVQVGPLPHKNGYLGLRSFEIKSSSSSRKVKYHAKEARIPLWDNPTEGGVTLNVVVDGVTKCFRMPTGGWTMIRYGTYKYLDREGTYGPVRRAKLSRGISRDFDVRVDAIGSADEIGLAPPNPGLRVDTNLEVAGLTDFCSSSVGGKLRANHERVFKIQSSPPPTSCAVSACAP